MFTRRNKARWEHQQTGFFTNCVSLLRPAETIIIIIFHKNLNKIDSMTPTGVYFRNRLMFKNVSLQILKDLKDLENEIFFHFTRSFFKDLQDTLSTLKIFKFIAILDQNFRIALSFFICQKMIFPPFWCFKRFLVSSWLFFKDSWRSSEIPQTISSFFQYSILHKLNRNGEKKENYAPTLLTYASKMPSAQKRRHSLPAHIALYCTNQYTYTPSPKKAQKTLKLRD